jgi:hypothetical protein
LKIRRRLHNFQFYGGDQWFNLNQSAAKIVLEVYKQQKFQKVFKYTNCADEIIISMLIMNSDYNREMLINKSLRYIDWRTGPEYPRTLTIEDQWTLLKSDANFARKFDESKDYDVIKLIVSSLQVNKNQNNT